MLLDPTCVLCGATAAPVCDRCALGMGPPRSLPPPLGIDACSALLDYDGARPLLTALKNGNRRDLVGWIADCVVTTFPPPPPGAVLTWAPTGTARRRARGFDQSELLARALARRWAHRCAALLRRLPGPPQAGLPAGARRQNPAFVAAAAAGGPVVVVDDVVTTGATLAAAAAALRSAGAPRVSGLVVARAAARGHTSRDRVGSVGLR